MDPTFPLTNGTDLDLCSSLSLAFLVVGALWGLFGGLEHNKKKDRE